MGNSGDKIRNYENLNTLFQKKFEDEIVYKIVRDNNTGQKYFLLLGSFTGDAQRAEINLESLQKLNNVVNICKLLEKQVEKDQMLCFEKFKISLLFEYQGNSMQEIIKKNRDSQNKLSEKNIWNTIKDLLEYLEDLRNHGVVNGDLQPCYIIIDEGFDFRAFVLSPLMYLDYQNAYNKRMNSNNYLSTFSPELLDNFSTRKSFPDVNEKLSEIFSFGICILSLATLNDFQVFYDFKENRVNFNKIKIEMTNLIEKFNYSDDLFYFLNLMLKENYHDRANYQDLKKLLRKIKY